MFSGSQIRLPIRILDELEVLQLSGLEEQWANTHLNDAERLPERVIRDYCGNCFHPKLIGSALGDDHILKQWINGEIAENTGEVANKNTVLQVYTRLCQDVEQLSCRQGIKLGTNLVKDFPLYPDPCDPQRRVAVPRIHDATIHGPRVPKQTKQERYQFSCNQAAIHYLGVPLCQLLRDSDLEICFDSFRAPTNAVFQFEDYIRFIFGCQANQLSTCKTGQGPRLGAASQIKCAFQGLERKRSRNALLDCLLAAGCYNQEFLWPVGHFVAFRDGSHQRMYYFGSAQPKIILLIIEDQYGQPSPVEGRTNGVQSHRNVQGQEIAWP